MEIRKSTNEDIDQIVTLFDIARTYMMENGNSTQWGSSYPEIDVIRKDISKGISYVIVMDKKIVGTFSFSLEEEPTYKVIKNGEWHKNGPYGTIHRVASNGVVKGIAKCCFEYCAKQIDYLRIDTHENNSIMKAAITKYGFKKCGNIYVRGGAERIAYDFFG